MNTLNIENLGTLGRGEISDLIGESSLDGRLTPEGEVFTPQLGPFGITQSEMPSEYFFSSGVIDLDRLSKGFQLGSVRSDLGSGGLVNLEDGASIRLPMSCSQEGNRSDGLDSASVVYGQLNWCGPEEIV